KPPGSGKVPAPVAQSCVAKELTPGSPDRPLPTMGTLPCDPAPRLTPETSPGPVYFLDPKVTRFGRSCTPAYSMQGRGKSRDLEVTPGPGAYSPEK
ncbi:hypothetical protein E2I00_016077, partial [Balaenoptera physalus]